MSAPKQKWTTLDQECPHYKKKYKKNHTCKKADPNFSKIDIQKQQQKEEKERQKQEKELKKQQDKTEKRRKRTQRENKNSNQQEQQQETSAITIPSRITTNQTISQFKTANYIQDSNRFFYPQFFWRKTIWNIWITNIWKRNEQFFKKGEKKKIAILFKIIHIVNTRSIPPTKSDWLKVQIYLYLFVSHILIDECGIPELTVRMCDLETVCLGAFMIFLSYFSYVLSLVYFFRDI